MVILGTNKDKTIQISMYHIMHKTGNPIGLSIYNTSTSKSSDVYISVEELYDFIMDSKFKNIRCNMISDLNRDVCEIEKLENINNK